MLCVAVSQNREERARLGRFCPLLPRRPTLRRLDDDTSQLFSSQETEEFFFIGINIPEYRPYYDGVLGWSGTWLWVLFWSLYFYRFLSFPFVPFSFLLLSGVVGSTADVMICWEARASIRMWLGLRFRSMGSYVVSQLPILWPGWCWRCTTHIPTNKESTCSAQSELRQRA